MKQYEHQKYPSWRFHESEAPKLVHSDEEHDELGDEWSDVPVEKSCEPEACEEPQFEESAPVVKKGRKPKKQE